MMTTRLTTVLLQVFLCIATLVPLVASAPMWFEPRDVWDPTILEPNVGTFWLRGHKYNVTWETDDAPVNVTNPIGLIILGNSTDRNISVLASDFPLKQGTIQITVPTDLTPGYDYDIVLYGDSGNFSPLFSIL